MAIYKIIINGEFRNNDNWFTLLLQSDAEWVIPKEGAIQIRDENIGVIIETKRFVLEFKPLSKIQNIELYAETDAPILAIKADMPSNSSTLTVSSSVDSYVRKADDPNSFKFDLRLV
jgi:hypothetical protein